MTDPKHDDEIEITSVMLDAAANELWQWVAFRTGYDSTMPLQTARKEAELILRAALAAELERRAAQTK